jgi:hypothetical protein
MKKIISILLIYFSISIAQVAEQPAGSGTQSDPYLIATLNNLYWVTQNTSSWGSYFLQTADIDASSTSSWDGGAGFTPIGNGSVRNFGGNYDGNGYTISSLYINRPSTDYVGMFGRSTGAVVSNLGLTSVNFSGDEWVGGISGYIGSSSEISNCYTTGALDGTGYAGGITGYGAGTNISNCYCSISVLAGGNLCGTFIGESYQCTIANSYCHGSFTRKAGYTDTQLGAFCGDSRGSTIEHCYSTASVYYNGADDPTDKGFLGYKFDNDGTYTDNFFDSEVSNQSTDANNGATPKTTAEMKTLSTFTDVNWDFAGETVNGTNDWWDMDYSGTINSGYPYLYWQDGEDESLPVELTSFTASATDGKVTLHWITESEFNNDAFIIERSDDRENFITIAEIKGQGTTSQKTEYTFTDNSVINNFTYYYRLSDRDLNGVITYHRILTATPAKNDEMIQTGLTIAKYVLYENYPNPFNPETKISFDVPTKGEALKEVSVAVYDILGRLVKTLYSGKLSGGHYDMKWNGRESGGNDCPSGVYFLLFQTADFIKTQKMMLVR